MLLWLMKLLVEFDLVWGGVEIMDKHDQLSENVKSKKEVDAFLLKNRGIIAE